MGQANILCDGYGPAVSTGRCVCVTICVGVQVQVEDLTVLFPYDYVYPEQYNYMLNLKKTLDGNRTQ